MAALGQAGEKCGDLSGLQIINQPRHHPPAFGVGAGVHETGDGIDDDNLGLKVDNLLEHGGQVHFQAVERGSRCVKSQQAAFDQWVQAQPDGLHVADDLVGRFLEREEKGALSALARSLGKIGGNDGLAGPRSSREQNAAAAEKAPPAQHCVEAGDAGGNPLGGYLVIQSQRRDGEHADALVPDEKWKFVGAVQGAAIFYHAQMPRGDLLVDPMIEQDDAIGHVLLQAMTCELFAPAFGGNDGRHALVLEPAEEPAQFQGVQNHALGANGINGVVESDEQPLQVILAALLDFTALNVDIVDRNFFASDKTCQIKSERRDIGLQLRLCLLKGHEYARLAELRRAAHEEFRGK